MNYFALRSALDDRHCALYDLPEDNNELYRPARGIEMGELYTEPLTLQMASEASGIQVPDLVHNAFNYLMVSGRMRAVLEEHATGEIEFLPFILLDHKGKVAADDYSIANVLSQCDALDRERSDGHLKSGRRKEFQRLLEMALDHDQIGADLNIFRVSAMRKLVIVREDLRAALEQAELTGLNFYGEGEPVHIL